MSIPNYLAKIKSSGVYRYVFDKSEIPASERSSMRLVVGYSEKGPFNTPVYIGSTAEFIATFGSISRRMERKGVYFHRLALQALEVGPILALNIKPFKNETAKMLTFNASDIKFDGYILIDFKADSIKLKNFAKNDDAWGYDEEDTITVTGRVPEYKFNDKDKSFEYAQYDKDAKFIRILTTNPDGSPVAKYYGDPNQSSAEEGEMPAFAFNLMSYNGKYYEKGQYATYKGKTYGVDQQGNLYDVKTNNVVKDDTNNNVTKESDGVSVLKDKVKIDGTAQTDKTNDIMDDALVALDGTNTAGERWSTIYDTNRFWKVTENIMDITPMKSGKAAKTDYIRIVQTGSKQDSVTVFMRPVIPAGYHIKISDWYSSEVSDEMPSYMESIADHYLSEFFMEIYVFRGNLNKADLYTEDGTLGVNVRDMSDVRTTKWYPFCKVEDGVLKTNSDFKDPFGRYADALEAMSDVSTSNFIGKYQGIMFPGFRDATGTFISIDSVFNAGYASHKCVMALNEALLDEAYEADLNADGDYSDDPGENPPSFVEGLTSPTVSDAIHQISSSVHSGSGDIVSIPVNTESIGYYLEGYNYTTILKNESGRALIEDKIYTVLGYKGIYEALTNNVDVDYKYWVDTFQGYPGVSMKSNISAIVKQKFNALAILNFPPMIDCAVHLGYPGLNGGFDMAKVTNRSSGITLPAEVQGASWAAYYTQVQMTDGANKFFVPSAALVSNLFMEKWRSRQPYYIVAGPNYGRIAYPGVIGPDYNYARNDLDALEPYGVNAIVYIPRKGLIINSNQTAKQTPVSALSKVHVRELVTYLQDTIENMLYNYQWELNTSVLRDNVRAKAEVILGLCKSNGGIYDYYVQCDERNNTPEIIDNEMLVLDIEIEPARGCGKMIQTLTIHRTGGLAATARN